MISGLDLNRQGTSPLKFPRTKRNKIVQVGTSFQAGKMVPIAYVPLLREDAVRNGRVRFNFQLQETAEIILNPIRVDVRAYLVSHLCDPRFEKSMDQLNRSYAGQPQVEGGDVVPFIETHAMGTAGSKAVYKALGLHAASAKEVNTWPLKAYNLIWNFLAANRSADLTPRSLTDATLAPAFWNHSRFAHIKPDFDAAVAEGEVALNVVEGALPVRGIGLHGTLTSSYVNESVRVSAGAYGGDTVSMSGHTVEAVGPLGAGEAFMHVATNAGFPAIYAEMIDKGITVSLANIELAKKTQAFARLREQYDGHLEGAEVDEWIVDMLMNGLSIPDLAWTQPILLAQQSTMFSQGIRYATDSGNLDESATNGSTFVDLKVRMPKGQRINSGGVIVFVAQVLPEQMWERQRDPYFHSTEVTDWPEALRDTLDPQKVEEVFNSQIDTSHATPNAVFGYAPMNWEWDMRFPQLGGRFFKAAADQTFDEDRQRFWAQEVVNPTLSESFYICPDLHQNVFLNGGTAGAWTDVIDAYALGNIVIDGNTQFGPALIEANGNYDAVAAKAPTDRIESGE